MTKIEISVKVLLDVEDRTKEEAWRFWNDAEHTMPTNSALVRRAFVAWVRKQASAGSDFLLFLDDGREATNLRVR